MKKLFLVSIIASILISLITCSKKDNKISSGKIQFSVNAKISSAKKSALIVSTAKSILVSIEDSTGKVFYDSENVELYNFNGIYTSKPLPLKTGFYKLTKFMVVDSAGNVIYAAPKKGSPKAYLVQNPLDIDFSIEEDVVTKLAPEVLSTEESTPADFGYFDATFVIVKTFDFLISIFAYDQTTRNFKLTDASITISDSIKELYTLQLGAKTNKITVNDGLSIYNLRITKNGYSAITKSFTSDSLKACFNKPLVIVLISSSVNINNGLVAYYPFNGNANDESGNGNNGTVYGATLTQDRFGNIDKAYYFNGINNFIEIIPNSLITSFGDFTLSAWIKNDGWKSQSPYDRQYIFDGHAAGKEVYGGWFKQGFTIYYDNIDSVNTANSGIMFSEYDYTDIAGFYKTSNSLSQWHNIILIRKNSNTKMLFDNEEVPLSQGTQKADIIDMNHPWYIGTFCGNNPNYLVSGKHFNYSFKGTIDEIRIYNRTLSDNEISALQNN